MKRFFKTNLVLLLVIALGFVAAFVSIGNRMAVEAKDKTYDIVIDMDELRKMAAQSDHDEYWWLNEWKQYGINKVGVWETSIKRIVEEWPDYVRIVSARELSAEKPVTWYLDLPKSMWPALSGPETVHPDEYDFLIVTDYYEVYEAIRRGFTMRYPGALTASEWVEGGPGYLYFDGTAETALYSPNDRITEYDSKTFTTRREVVGSIYEYLNLGFRAAEGETVRRCEELGYEIVPRTVAYKNYNGDAFAFDVFKEYSTAFRRDPAYLIVGGPVYGLEGENDASFNYLKSHATSLCLIEASDQLGNMKADGLFALSERFGDRAVRTYSVWDYIQYRYAYFGYDGPQEIQNTLYRAVTERNIRMIYYKPMKQTDESYLYITDPDDYAMVWNDLEARLAAHGYKLGTAAPAEELATPLVLRILTGFGAVAAAILLLKTLFTIPKKAEYVLLAIGIVGVVGCFFVAPNASNVLAGFANGVIWPCLAAALYFCFGRKAYDDPAVPGPTVTIRRGVALLAVCTILAVLGGLTAAAPFGSNAALVEQVNFRGIKFSQIIPMLYAFVAFVAWFGFRKDKEKIGRIEVKDVTHAIFLDIKVWMLLIVAVIGAAAAIYIIRTGHTSNLNTNTLEVELRNKLEELLPARPRTKEFLIAFPCLLLFVYACERKYKFFIFLFGFASVIGFASVSNTFMHLRTPVCFSLERLTSVPIGIVLGIFCVACFHLLCLLWKRLAEPKEKAAE
jgi:hypothetical protein